MYKKLFILLFTFYLLFPSPSIASCTGPVVGVGCGSWTFCGYPLGLCCSGGMSECQQHQQQQSQGGGITGITSPSSIFTNSQYFLVTLISRLLTFSIAGAGFVFLAQIVIAGYTYLTSMGEPGAVQSATKQLTNATIGLLLVISTYFIIQIIQTMFGLKIL